MDQTYRNLELIILDNASTDKTAAIGQYYRDLDDRVRYVKQPYNKGAAPNFNDGFYMARGEYFRWHAHDDYLEPTYLERCVAMLEGNSHIVLCHSLVRRIDHDGGYLKTVRPFNRMMISPWQHERVRSRLRNPNCYEGFGLFRRSAVRLTPPIGSYVNMDRVFLLDLACAGLFACVEQPLFAHREHNGRSVRVPTRRGQEIVYDSDNEGKAVFSTWRALRISHAIIRDRVDAQLKKRCYWYLLHMLRYHWNWAYLLIDPLMVLTPRVETWARSLKKGVSFRRSAKA